MIPRILRIAVPMLAFLVFCGCAEDGFLMCGDGNLHLYEECDDGNTEDGDGCSAVCKIEGDPGLLPTLASIQQHIFTPICGASHYPGGVAPMPLNTQEAAYENLVGVPSFLSYLPRVDPGNPAGSFMVQKIEGSLMITGQRMPPPPASKLEPEQIGAIRQWIEDGALP